MFGYGPRYLHSTGQLHKGGANNGVFIVVIAEADDDLADSRSTVLVRQCWKWRRRSATFSRSIATGRRAMLVHAADGVDPELFDA